ncbi:MAG TPA: hypothetical protein VJ343_02470 [archaeon]|nr:hypothetical protein [archaeon]
MPDEKTDSGNVIWEATPYKGVFVSPIHKEDDPSNPEVPKMTIHAVRVDPGCEIPLHCHSREDNWTELIVFSPGSYLEIYGFDNQIYQEKDKPVCSVVNAGEAYGIRNLSGMPLMLISIMEPGFSGYEEIKNL